MEIPNPPKYPQTLNLCCVPLFVVALVFMVEAF